LRKGRQKSEESLVVRVRRLTAEGTSGRPRKNKIKERIRRSSLKRGKEMKDLRWDGHQLAKPKKTTKKETKAALNTGSQRRKMTKRGAGTGQGNRSTALRGGKKTRKRGIARVEKKKARADEDHENR